MSIDAFEEALSNKLVADIKATGELLDRVYYAYGDSQISDKARACLLGGDQGSRLVIDVAKLGRVLKEENISYTVAVQRAEYFNNYVTIHSEVGD